MSVLQVLGAFLLAFAVVKFAIARAALRRIRDHRAGKPGAVDPFDGHARPWLLWAWVGWRYAAAALSTVVGLWLLVR